MPYIDKKKLIEDAKTFVGTPWVYQGRNRFGVDCSGLLLASLKEQGIDFKFPHVYTLNMYGPDIAGIIESQGLFKAVETEDRQPGDLLVLRLKVMPQHSGILLEPDDKNGELFIHCLDSSIGVQISRLNQFWIRKILRVYRPLEG